MQNGLDRKWGEREHEKKKSTTHTLSDANGTEQVACCHLPLLSLVTIGIASCLLWTLLVVCGDVCG